MIDTENARVVLVCNELQPNIDFFKERLGFRLDGISPADAPKVALMSGRGLSLELRKGLEGSPTHLRIGSGQESELRAPNGTLVELRPSAPEVSLPPIQQELVITRLQSERGWGTGRAGMQYRDLIPGRLGGRFIASHIRIPKGGPVPDSVHYHHIRFQMIFCVKGWVRVAYEDQGEPQRLEAGDCFLQPPGMRHQVLESSDGLEVIEIASPAEHDTWMDHDLVLPSASVQANREFEGQRFVFHQASQTPWIAHVIDGFERRDLGIGAATGGLAQVAVLRPRAGHKPRAPWPSPKEFLFLYVLRGGLALEQSGGEGFQLAAGDCASLPPGEAWTLGALDDQLEWLEVRL